MRVPSPHHCRHRSSRRYVRSCDRAFHSERRGLDADIAEWHELRRAVYPPEAPLLLGSDLDWAPLKRLDRLERPAVGRRVRACAWITERTITLVGRGVRAAGDRGVMTHPADRRRGFGRAVIADRPVGLPQMTGTVTRRHPRASQMRKVHDLLDTLDLLLALLFSSAMAAPFWCR
jgi:GNAT superfamily N-acetyltransferase